MPTPNFDSFDSLNAHLERECLGRMDAKLGDYTKTMGECMRRDLGALLAAPYPANNQLATHVSFQSLEHFRSNGHSLPVAFRCRDVLEKGYVEKVVISCAAGAIDRHRNSYEYGGLVFGLIHYLPQLEQKTGALE